MWLIEHDLNDSVSSFIHQSSDQLDQRVYHHWSQDLWYQVTSLHNASLGNVQFMKIISVSFQSRTKFWCICRIAFLGRLYTGNFLTDLKKLQ
jgi:hypothetical protein